MNLRRFLTAAAGIPWRCCLPRLVSLPARGIRPRGAARAARRRRPGRRARQRRRHPPERPRRSPKRTSAAGPADAAGGEARIPDHLRGRHDAGRARRPRPRRCGDSDDFKRKLASRATKLLMEQLLQAEAKAAVTEAAMRKVYDEAIRQMSKEPEVRARHILVETEDEAKAVLAELKKGADFAELAKTKSKDPGSAEGGDLGYFTKDQMVPEFSEVAFKLDKGAAVRSGEVAVRLARHQGRGQARRASRRNSTRSRTSSRTYVVRKSQTELITKLRADGQDRAARRRRPRRLRPPRPRAAGRAEEVDIDLAGPSELKPGSVTSASLAPVRPLPWPWIGLVPAGMPDGMTAMSPPSPRSHRSMSPICRRSPACGSRPAPPASSIRAAPTCCSRCSTRAPRGGRAHPLEMPLGAGRVVPRQTQGRQGAGAGGQFRQRQRVHRQDRPRGGGVHREARQPGRGLQAGRSVPRLDRRDRRAVAAQRVRRRDGAAGRGRRARPLPRCRQGDHDHRHVSQGRDRARRSSATPRSRSTASPRAPA